MPTAPFDEVLICDWSAAAAPRTGRDSIWIARQRCGEDPRTARVVNPPTRHQATGVIRDAIDTALSSGTRLFCGFDFSFGYPQGFAAAIGDLLDADPKAYEIPFAVLSALINDDAANSNNRFAVADALNRHLGQAMFWGKPRGKAMAQFEALSSTKAGRPRDHERAIGEFRLCEQRLGRRIATNWQLLGVGSVGSQVLCGMPVIEGLRRDFPTALSLWPYECVEISNGVPVRRAHGPVVCAEVWPTLFDPVTDGAAVKDEAQVRHVAAVLAGLDEPGWERLVVPPAFASITTTELHVVLGEEGWMFGLAELATGDDIHKPNVCSY